jgi:hypothetical protein
LDAAELENLSVFHFAEGLGDSFSDGIVRVVQSWHVKDGHFDLGAVLAVVEDAINDEILVGPHITAGNKVVFFDVLRVGLDDLEVSAADLF